VARVRTGKPGAPLLSAEWKRRVSAGARRGLALRRAGLRILGADADRLAREGLVVPALLPAMREALAEAAEILDALGGHDVSPQRRAMVGDFARLGAIVRAEVAAYLGNPERDRAGTIGGIIAQRRGLLALLVLERFERDVPSLASYTAQRAAAESVSAPATDAVEGRGARENGEGVSEHG